MTHRLLSRSAWRPWVHTNRSPGGRPGRQSFHAPPGNGLNVPSRVASPTEGVGTSVQRGKLPKSRPWGDTAALVIMTLPDEATVISSMILSARRASGGGAPAPRRPAARAALPQREPPSGRMPERRLHADRGQLDLAIALGGRAHSLLPARERLLDAPAIGLEGPAKQPRHASSRIDRPVEPQQGAGVRARVGAQIVPVRRAVDVGRVDGEPCDPARE